MFMQVCLNFSHQAIIERDSLFLQDPNELRVCAYWKQSH